MSEFENNGQTEEVVEEREYDYTIQSVIQGELGQLHDWIATHNIHPDLINEEFFPILHEKCPKYLGKAKERAIINFENWERILEVQGEMPVEARIWQGDTDEKDFLFNAAMLGKGKEAWEILQNKFKENLRLEMAERSKVGFSTNGNHKEE